MQLQSDLQLKSVKQVYMIWLWMDAAWDWTFERIQDKGNLQVGVIGQLGATAFMQQIATMQLELPALVYATQLEMYWQSYIATPDNTCTTFYQDVCGFPVENAAALCGNATFDFSDSFSTSFALTNIYFFTNGFNAKFYN